MMKNPIRSLARCGALLGTMLLLLPGALSRTAIAQNEADTVRTQQPRRPIIKRRTLSERNEDETATQGGISVRRQAFNRLLTQETENAPWKRIIYREVNLDSAENAALYYPPRPAEGRQNLFYTLFRLIEEDKVPAYEYVDGAELFDEAHRLKFRDFLDRFGILYEAQGEKITVAPADIPGDLVRSYYLKEEYYFDPIAGNIDVKVLALCPVLLDDINPGEMLRYPLFWVKYSDCKPYLATEEVMLSDTNNANTASLDSYFRRGLYKGDIYKTQNRLGKALAQYCPTPDSLRSEQARIEAELASFDASLWRKASLEEKQESGKNGESKVEPAEKEASQPAKKTERAKRQAAKKKQAPQRKSSTQDKSSRSARGRF